MFFSVLDEKKSCIIKGKLFNILILLTLFSIAFRFYSYSVVFSIISVVILLSKNKYSVKFFLAYWACVLFYILYILIGFNHNGIIDTENKFILKQILFLTTSSFFFLLPLYINDSNNLIRKYAIMSFVYGYIIISYSYFNGYNGYGSLFNPIQMVKTNSPLIALLVVLSFVILSEAQDYWDKRKYFLFSFFGFINLYVCTIYLGSRASFILLVVYFSCFIFMRSKNKEKVSITIILFVFIFIIIAKLNLIDFGGFASRGFESSRFGRFKYGIDNLFNYPWGGMPVISVENKGSWFHNIFLDIARVSGFWVMIYWLILFSFFSVIIYINKLAGLKTFGLFFFILTLALSQDLAFDGQYNIMCLMFFVMGYNAKKYFERSMGMTTT